MDKTTLLKRFRQFCQDLSSKDKVAVLHHSDADGFCSALITAKAIEKLTGKRPVVVQHYDYGNKKLLRKTLALIEKEKANILVVLDVGIDSQSPSLLDFCHFEKCLVVDHHKMFKDLNSETVLFLKAQFFTERDSSSYVASKFAFDLFNNVTNVEELDWLACIGILGDMNLKNWQPFVQKTLVKWKTSLTWLYSFLDLIAAVEVLASNKMTELFWVFYNAENPNEVLKSRFQGFLEQFKQERDSLVELFEEKGEFFPELELYFYAIRARHENIKSYVINQISEMRPDKTIILIQYLGGGMVRFSARRQDGKVKVNDLLVEAVKGIPESGAGGHAPAAAGSIPKQHLSKFKENVLKILKERQKKS